jgi:hypothetical protein
LLGSAFCVTSLHAALTPTRLLNTVLTMSLTQIKDQAAHLQLSEQRELIAFLISRQTEQDEDFKRTLAQKIDDPDPSHWVDLDDLRKRYSE